MKMYYNTSMQTISELRFNELSELKVALIIVDVPHHHFSVDILVVR